MSHRPQGLAAVRPTCSGDDVFSGGAPSVGKPRAALVPGSPGRQLIAARERCRGAGSARIFPLRLGGQAERGVLPLGQPAAVGDGVMPAHEHHRFVVVRGRSELSAQIRCAGSNISYWALVTWHSARWNGRVMVTRCTGRSSKSPCRKQDGDSSASGSARSFPIRNQPASMLRSRMPVVVVKVCPPRSCEVCRKWAPVSSLALLG